MKKSVYNRRLFVWVFLITCLWYGWRCIEPYYYIIHLNYSNRERMLENIKADETHLSDMGPRAIDPMIDELRNAGSFEWASGSLLGVLAKYGEPAHQRLLFQIDHDDDRMDRIGLINALQISFNDYSRIRLWLDDIRRGLIHNPGELQESLEYHFVGVPKPTNDHEVFKGDFVAWYAKIQKSTGRLPAYDFYRIDDL